MSVQLNGECFNFTQATSIAAMAPPKTHLNISAPQYIRIAQTFVILLNHIESSPRAWICKNRPPFADMGNRDFDLYQAFARNLVEDGIGSICLTLTYYLADCYCGDRNTKTSNETSRECFLRQLKPGSCHCSDGKPLIYSKLDYPSPFQYDDNKNNFTLTIPQIYYASAKVFYSISLIGTVVCCSLVLFIYCKTPSLQTISNIFIMNLIMGNSIITILSVPIQIMDTFFLIPYPWIIPRPLWLADSSCRLYFLIKYLGFFGTSYSLALIAFERYNAICRPVERQRQLSKKQALELVGTTWFLSSILAIPSMFSHVSVNSSTLQPSCSLFKIIKKKRQTQNEPSLRA